MERGERLVAAAVLAALYLRGTNDLRPLQRRRWCLVRDALLSLTPSWREAHEALASRGLFDEASALSTSDRIPWALEHIESGQVLTAACAAYPSRWLSVLGASAPPALWMSGPPPWAKSVAVVGRRSLDTGDRSFAAKLGGWIIGTGHCIVSGGAVGADSLAADGALQVGGDGRVVVLLPFGISMCDLDPRVTYLSTCAPDSGFTTTAAMERNSLIYASSSLAVVVKCGFKQGGTWHGATDALRRRLCRVAVRNRKNDLAVAALSRLGALVVNTRSEIEAAVSAPDEALNLTRQHLFG